MASRCPNCFNSIEIGSICPHCHFDIAKEKQYLGVLPKFTVLKNQYTIGRVLGRGGFGITYIAKDNFNNKIYAIKEYMPSEYSKRSGNTTNIVPFSDAKSRHVFNHGKEKFLEEAKTLIKLQANPNVVSIYSFFTENNTAYLVMEYLDGQDLRQMARSNGGKIDPNFATQIFMTVASSLMEIHRMNILHRDLSPENIIVTSDNSIKLIDFGAARNYVSLQNKGMSILLKPGFAPPEQYSQTGTQGPWSDVYALCATIYNVISGKLLPDALYRYRGTKVEPLYSLGCNVSKKLSDIIDKGLILDHKKRYQNFKELLDDFEIQASKKSKNDKKNTIFQEDSIPLPDDSSNHGFKEKHEKNSNTNYDTPIPPNKKNVTPYIATIKGNMQTNKMMLAVNKYLVIGRSPQQSNYVVPNDTNVSRVHCYVKFDGKDFYILDKKSANNTYFSNGEMLIKNKEYKVKAGTMFYLATPNNMLIVEC